MVVRILEFYKMLDNGSEHSSPTGVSFSKYRWNLVLKLIKKGSPVCCLCHQSSGFVLRSKSKYRDILLLQIALYGGAQLCSRHSKRVM